MKKQFKVVCLFIAIILAILCFQKYKTKGRLQFYKSVCMDTIQLHTNKFSSQEFLNQEFQSNGVDYENYLNAASFAIAAFLKYDEEKNKEVLYNGKIILDNLKSTFYRNHYFPRPNYNELHYGWVSSMDAPTVLMATTIYYELTKDQDYKKFAEELSTYILLTTDKHGFNISDEKFQMWPLEYAQLNATEDNSYMVLNGSLTGYIYTLAIAMSENNKALLEYCKKVEDTYIEHFKDYHFTNNDYCYYMLNPITTNSLHYIIYEIQLLDSAYKLNKNDKFKLEKDFRQEVLQKLFKMEFTNDTNGREYILNRAPAPHPYYIDTYTTKIQFLDNTNSVIQEIINENAATDNIEEFRDNMFLNGDVPKGGDTYKVFSVLNGRDFLLSSGIIEPTNKKAICVYNINAIVSDDASLRNNQVFICPEISSDFDARLTFQLPISEPKNINNLYAIEVSNLNAIELKAGLLIYDSEGNGCGRYAMPLLPGKNLVLFSYSGFHENDKILNIDKIVLRIFTDDLKNQNYLIQLGKLLKFENNTSLLKYIDDKRYLINPQLFKKTIN